MTDKRYRQQVKRLNRLIKKWLPMAGLHDWRINFHFIREGFEGEARQCGALASTNAQWEYMLANIEWDMQVVSETPDDYLEYALCHELAHCLTSGMCEGDTEKTEQAATAIGKALVWARYTE